MPVPIFLRVALVAVSWGLSATLAAASAGLQEGEAFPTLNLPSLEAGEPLSIADFRGRKIALHVFASW